MHVYTFNTTYTFSQRDIGTVRELDERLTNTILVWIRAMQQ